MTNTVKQQERRRVAVWFDRPRNCLCLLASVDADENLAGRNPDGAILRVPLMDGEDFIEALMAAIRRQPHFWKLMDAVQVLLDQRAVQAVNLARRFRSERDSPIPRPR